MQNKEKKKLFYWSDSPVVQTGLGRVSQNILRSIYETGEWDIEVMGANHNVPFYDQKEFPYTIYNPKAITPKDPYGMQILSEFLMEGGFDVFMSVFDADIVMEMSEVIKKAKEKNNFTFIAYIPIDSEFVAPIYKDIIELADIPIYYSKHGYELCKKEFGKLADKGEVIYHGTDPDVFYPIVEQDRKRLRKKIFDIDDDTTLFVNVGRNQWRKDFYRTVLAYLVYYETYNKNSKLYLHCKREDLGGDIFQVIAGACCQMGVPIKEMFGDHIMITAKDFNESFGVPVSSLNKVYNCADAIISTNQGEGWGLTTTEGMSVQRPVVAPRNTSTKEILGEKEERGYLVDSGSNINLWQMNYGWSNTPRPVVDINSMVAKMIEATTNKKESKKKAIKARNWILNNTWSQVGKKWIKVLDKAYEMKCKMEVYSPVGDKTGATITG